MKKDVDSLKDIKILSLPIQIGFAISFLLILGVVLWSIFGTIAVSIDGRGILINESGLKDIQSPVKGTLKEIFVEQGDFVKSGDLLMKIEDPELQLKISASEKRLHKLNEELKNLQDRIRREYTAERQALQTKIKSTEFNIRELEKNIASYNLILEKHQKLLQEGLISQKIYRSEEQDFVLKKVDLETKKGELSELIAEEQREYRTQEIIQKEEEVRKEKENLDLLLIAQKQTQIVSPESGRVLELKTFEGQIVSPGDSLVWLEVDSQKNFQPLILAYFPIQTGKKIQLGDLAIMRVKTVNENIYGGILGRVDQISQYAVSETNVINRIQNKMVVSYLMNNQPAVIEALIKPLQDPQNPHLFLWSSGNEPKVLISKGTVGDVEAVIEQARPLYYLIPIDNLKWPKDTHE